MEEVTQNLVECERTPFASLKDLTHDLVMAYEIVTAGQAFLLHDLYVSYSGYAAPKSAHNQASSFYVQFWHGKNHYRTERLDLPYVGVLYVDLPAEDAPERYLKVAA